MTSGRARRSRAVAAATLAIGLLLGGSLAATPAWAADYPSWDEVLNARNNETATAAEVGRIEGVITQLAANVEATEAVAMEKGDAYFVAQQNFDVAAYKADQLQAQADAAQVTADASMRQAGQLAARTQRVRSADLTATLLFSGAATEDLLSQLGMASKVSQQSTGVFAKAQQDHNTAQALTDQAVVAKGALQELAAIAEDAMIVAQAAADAASTALTEQTDNIARLQAQLATLKENRIATEAEYVAGIQAMWGAGASLGAGEISASGWARPSGGYISSSYGPRVPPKSGASSMHGGVDLAPGCGAPIFAAAGGTVEYAGWNGGYGYYVSVDHGDGTSTAYGHIASGGIAVRPGQGVGPGQLIAKVGTTGTSTGCHLHFEVRRGGSTTDPVAFLRNQGVKI